MNELESAVKLHKVLINRHSYPSPSKQNYPQSDSKPLATMVERFVQSLANANDSGTFDTSLEVKTLEHPRRKRSKCITELDREELTKFVKEFEARRKALTYLNSGNDLKVPDQNVYVEYIDSDSDFESTDQEYFDADDTDSTEVHNQAIVEPKTPENFRQPYQITEEDLRKRLSAKKRSSDEKHCRAARLLNFISSATKTIKHLKSSSCNNSRNSSPLPQRSKHFQRNGYRHFEANSDTEDDGISTSSQLTSRNISPDSSFELHPPIVPTFKITPPRDQRSMTGVFGQFLRSSLRAKRASVLRRSISNPDSLTLEDIMKEGASTPTNKTDFVEAKPSTARRGLGAAMIRNLDVLCVSTLKGSLIFLIDS